MDVIRELESSFNHQQFDSDPNGQQVIDECLRVMRAYVRVSQCVAVMSDLAANKSYISVGSFGKFFNLSETNGKELVIDTIWEEEIFSRIHPDDLFERHLLELRFFQYLKAMPPKERPKYNTVCRMRALNPSGEYQYIEHRTLYLQSTPNSCIWIALCLYTFASDQAPQLGINGRIINNETNETIPMERYNSCNNLLTKREKEVLRLISQGLLSKEISEQMSISTNTVNRHRQNILEKLNVKNSMEAVKVSTAMNLIQPFGL